MKYFYNIEYNCIILSLSSFKLLTIICANMNIIESTDKTFNILSLLPDELRKIIFYYIPADYYMKDETKLIKNVIRVYNIDHDHDLTKMYKLYFMKNFMPFYVYYFNTFEWGDNEYDGPEYGRRYYDTLELDSYVTADQYYQD